MGTSSTPSALPEGVGGDTPGFLSLLRVMAINIAPDTSLQPVTNIPLETIWVCNTH